MADAENTTSNSAAPGTEGAEKESLLTPAESGGNEAGTTSESENAEPKAEDVMYPEGDNADGNDGDSTDADENASGEDQKSEDDTDDKAEGAPEQYEEFKLPEGLAPDKEMTESFSAVAKELDLSQEGAQKLVDLFAEREQARLRQIETAYEQQIDQWQKDTLAAEEFSGDKGKENLQSAVRAMEVFGSDELKTFMNETGLGNHPEIVKLFHRIGNAISEDAMIFGDGAGGGREKSPEEIMYPDMTKQ